VWAYGYEDAVRVGRAVEELNFLWYEDPLPEDDIYGYIKLRQKLDIPILATEYTTGGLYGLTQFILQGATDMLRGDVAVKGGITSLTKIAHLAEAFRMKCEIHHGGNSMNNVANLHVTMAINNCNYFEVLLPAVAQKYGLVNDIEVDDQGLVHAPEGAGLGYEIDWDLVKRKTTTILR
jgi:L-alanine-DL-glutamate epimerase-like enolase superfamily enzyme